jgi:meiotic recombination protein SPO11
VEFRSEAHYVIIVEKDSVFAKLVQERVFDRLPCVLVTAKGFPDLGGAVQLANNLNPKP